MFWRSALAICAFAGCVSAAPATPHPDFGRVPAAVEIDLWNIDVRPDGRGLPPGMGTAAHGRQVYEENCQACHGANGAGGPKDRLVGGQGTLATEKPVKTIGSYWPYATTLFDYVRRAMPYQAPGTLSADDTYSVVAYLLNLNGLVSENASIDRATLTAVRMPNRDGFIPDREFSKLTPTPPPDRGKTKAVDHKGKAGVSY